MHQTIPIQVYSFVDTGVWRRARKAFQLFLTAEAVDRHLPTQEAESIQLLHDLLTSPEVRFLDHLNYVYVFDMFNLVGTIYPYHAYHSVPARIPCIWEALPGI